MCAYNNMMMGSDDIMLKRLSGIVRWILDGRYDVALFLLNQVLRRSRLLGAYYFRAMLWLRVGRYKKALKDLRRVLVLNPGFVDVYYSLYLVYSAMGDSMARYYLKKYERCVCC